jgi:hypothetical protein
MFVGTNFFFPGFVFSLPLTLVAARFWPAFAPDVFPNVAFIVSIAIDSLLLLEAVFFCCDRVLESVYRSLILIADDNCCEQGLSLAISV